MGKREQHFRLGRPGLSTAAARRVADARQLWRVQVLDRIGRGHLRQRSRASLERRCVCGKARRISHMTPPLLVLASASPRRNELLRQLGLTFQVVAGDVPEIISESISPAEICQINAYRKARAVAKHY